MKKKKSLLWLLWLCVPVAAVIALLAAGTAGYFLYLDTQYDKAVFALEVHEYGQAQERLRNVATFYKDSPKLMMYAQAGEALERRDYTNARGFYAELGPFRDCRDMLQEVDYREACDALDERSYAEALDRFVRLKDYKDSQKKIDAACQSVLDTALAQYRQSNYQAAKTLLLQISDYQTVGKTVKKYLTLINAHGRSVDDGSKKYDEMEALFAELTKLGDFEDAEALRVSNPFILYRLEGSWRYGDTEYVMTFRYDSAKAAWFHNQDILDWFYNKIDSRTESYFGEYGWVNLLRYEFLAENRMEVFWLYPKDEGESYIYTREK